MKKVILALSLVAFLNVKSETPSRAKVLSGGHTRQKNQEELLKDNKQEWSDLEIATVYGLFCNILKASNTRINDKDEKVVSSSALLRENFDKIISEKVFTVTNLEELISKRKKEIEEELKKQLRPKSEEKELLERKLYYLQALSIRVAQVIKEKKNKSQNLLVNVPDSKINNFSNSDKQSQSRILDLSVFKLPKVYLSIDKTLANDIEIQNGEEIVSEEFKWKDWRAVGLQSSKADKKYFLSCDEIPKDSYGDFFKSTWNENEKALDTDLEKTMRYKKQAKASQNKVLIDNLNDLGRDIAMPKSGEGITKIVMSSSLDKVQEKFSRYKIEPLPIESDGKIVGMMGILRVPAGEDQDLLYFVSQDETGKVKMYSRNTLNYFSDEFKNGKASLFEVQADPYIDFISSGEAEEYLNRP